MPIYINKLDKAISNRTNFEHKTCRECAFGKIFYYEIYPNIDQYDDGIKRLILDIEKSHCEFHEIASTINTLEPKEEDQEKLRRAKGISTELFQKLLALKRLVSKHT
ncbi:CZB domain-containing protein [Hydrogenobacter thermophilus]|uniref:CZB domain-containing protein n=1 Tax=Hydrogenobacter thermophilus TaxID=940 RepID=UPI0030FC9CF7